MFPPTRHEQLLATTEALTPVPYTTRTAEGTPVLTCTRYDDPLVQAALLVLKKRPDPKAAALLAQLLGDVLTEEHADITLWEHDDVSIVPIPLSHKRMRERGFNQVVTVCNALPESLRNCITTDILMRIHDTPMQKTLKRAERFANVAEVFSVTQHTISLHGKQIFLVDDVITTGATLDAATRVLAHAGATVTPIAIARA